MSEYVNIVDAGNLLYPAREAIKRLGFTLKEELVGDRIYCTATKDNIDLHADSPIVILGLIKLYEILGPTPWIFVKRT